MMLQSADTAAMLEPMTGIFTARQIKAVDASERNLTLHLNADGAAQLVTEIVGRGILVERGSWIQNKTRAEVTLTDLQGQAICLRMIFELRGNEMVYVGPDPYAFGTTEIRLGRLKKVE